MMLSCTGTGGIEERLVVREQIKEMARGRFILYISLCFEYIVSDGYK